MNRLQVAYPVSAPKWIVSWKGTAQISRVSQRNLPGPILIGRAESVRWPDDEGDKRRFECGSERMNGQIDDWTRRKLRLMTEEGVQSGDQETD